MSTHTTIIEPFRIKSVEPIRFTTREQRAAALGAVSVAPFHRHARARLRRPA